MLSNRIRMGSDNLDGVDEGIPSRYRVITSEDITNKRIGSYPNYSLVDVYVGDAEYVIIPELINGEPLLEVNDLFNVSHGATQIKGVATEKPLPLVRLSFYGQTADNLELTWLDTSKIIDFAMMFNGFLGRYLDISHFDTSGFGGNSIFHVLNLFANAVNLVEVNLFPYTTLRDNNLQQMFNNTKSLEVVDLSMWDIRNTIARGAPGGSFMVGTGASIGYARTQKEADYLNSLSTSFKPRNLNFTVK